MFDDLDYGLTPYLILCVALAGVGARVCGVSRFRLRGVLRGNSDAPRIGGLVMTRTSRLLVVSLLLVSVVLRFSARVASAHGRTSIGKYELVIGFKNEPVG